MENSLWHIRWGDGDSTYIIAPDKETAIECMTDGKDMITSMTRLSWLYALVFQEGRQIGRKEVVDFVKETFVKTITIDQMLATGTWQFTMEDWGLEQC